MDARPFHTGAMGGGVFEDRFEGEKLRLKVDIQSAPASHLPPGDNVLICGIHVQAINRALGHSNSL